MVHFQGGIMTFDEWFAGADCYDTYDTARAAWNFQQAKIDQLMLEYCPKEMTEDQVAEWAKHQQVY